MGIGLVLTGQGQVEEDKNLTEQQFYFECWLNCYVNQIDGYAFGASERVGFQPIVPVITHNDGAYNREATINLPAYTFTAEQQQTLLRVCTCGTAAAHPCKVHRTWGERTQD